jgi:hypothetical protein
MWRPGKPPRKPGTMTLFVQIARNAATTVPPKGRHGSVTT